MVRRVYENGREIDADEVTYGLWMGSKVYPEVRYAHWSALVLCAGGHQPELPLYRGMLLRAPFEDAVWLDATEERLVVQAALFVAQQRREYTNTLVTCKGGLNRSGLVVALAMLELGHETEKIIRSIRYARSGALCNRFFEEKIRSYKPSRRG